MKELAMAIMALCRGKAASEVYDALEFVKDWVSAEAFVPTMGIKNPARDMTTGRVVDSEPCKIEDKEELKRQLAVERARADVLQEILKMNPLEVFVRTPEDSLEQASEKNPV